MLVLSVGQVTNKLYVISYISENIEQFAINMLISAVNHQVSDTVGGTEQRTEGEVCTIYFFYLFL